MRRASTASRCSASRGARRWRWPTRPATPSASPTSSSTAGSRAAGCCGGPRDRLQQEALISAIRAGWTDPDPTFRHVFGMLFLPDGTPAQMAWFDELQRRSTSAATAVRLYGARGVLDVAGEAPRVTTPTLVLHARDDRVVAVEEGRLLAALIPDARLVLLESANHSCSATSRRGPASCRRCAPSSARSPCPGEPVEDLSARELEVLASWPRG